MLAPQRARRPRYEGEYEAQIFSDGPDAGTVGTSLTICTKRVKPGDKLNVHLASGGGLAVIFTPRPKSHV
jgi:hypothetical protein